MLAINPNIYNNTICSFVDASLNIIISNNPGLLTHKEYYLYYYIKSDFKASLQHLSTLNVDFMSILDFMPIWRNLRHSIESLYDLYNLIKDPKYYSVLEYSSKKSKEYDKKYEKFIFKNKFTIPSKKNIAEELYDFNSFYRGDSNKLYELSKESNSYTHPNVFISIPPTEDIQSKANLLTHILEPYIDIFSNAYLLMLEKYNNGLPTTLSCINCILQNKNCLQCYNRDYILFKNSLNNIPFVQNEIQNGYYFQ